MLMVLIVSVGSIESKCWSVCLQTRTSVQLTMGSVSTFARTRWAVTNARVTTASHCMRTCETARKVSGFTLHENMRDCKEGQWLHTA